MAFPKVFGKNKKNIGVRVTDKKTGEQKVLLNPSGKGAKYAKELKDGVHYTNDGQVKTDRNGKPRRLTDTQKRWRSGYLEAQKDSAKAFKSRNKK